MDHNDIINLVCSHYECSSKELLRACRKPLNFERRAIVAYLCRFYLHMSENKIAMALLRDRTTVLYCIKKVHDWKKFPFSWHKELNELESIERKIYPQLKIKDYERLER